MGRRTYYWFLLLALIVNLNKAEEDLYKILGVSKKATTKEIKSAYRRKALDTHPDKNKGIPPEEAAAAFQKVVHAFEILSDSESRKRYDRTGNSNPTQQQRGARSFTFNFNRKARVIKLKDKFQVKEAQSRVLHIVSLEQLETVIVDDENNVLERNLLICFLTPPIEEHVMDEMVYPYPFAAKSDQGIWWEDLLQTTIVRFNRSNKLTEAFGIPKGDLMDAPIFLYGKRGQVFSQENFADWPRIQTRNRKTFESWVWDQIQVQVEFVNQHDHPVEIFWIHGTSGKERMRLGPNESEFHITKLTHEWWVRDARTDTHPDSPGRYRLADNTCLASWKITSDEHRQKLIIPSRKCYDLSGHCGFWERHHECRKNPHFMREQCAKTCRVCSDDMNDEL